MKLNIGCGYKRLEGYVNIDCSGEVKPDFVCDLDERKLPYEDNIVTHVVLHHSFEHFAQPLKVLEELYRVSKNNAVWIITVPFGWSWQDNLFHKTMGFHWNTFDKFLINNPRGYYQPVRLEVVRVVATSHGWLKILPFKRKLSSLFNNIYYEITYQLKIKKE